MSGIVELHLIRIKMFKIKRSVLNKENEEIM